MNRVLKTCLMWLLALALPMQGYAAATMFSCQATLELPLHTMHPTTHVHGMTDVGDMHHQHPGSTPQTVGSDLHHNGPDDHQHQHSSCSACAACCVGVAVIPTAPEWLPSSKGAELLPAAPIVAFSGHIPPGLDRPPRNILA